MFVRGTEKDLTIHQQQARERIQAAFRLSRSDNIRTLVLERLADIDALVFDGELGTKIPVTFRPLGPLLWGQTMSGPGSVAGKKSRIAVEISESLVGYAEVAPQYIWGTLIHELLHAYALVMARRNGMCRCGYRVAHGPGFLAAAVAAVKVLEIEAIGMKSLVGSQEEGLCPFGSR